MRRVGVVGVCLVLVAGCASPAPGAGPAVNGDTVAAYFSPPEAFPGPTWTKDGRAVDGSELNSIAGPDHCDWQSAVMLHLGWSLGTVSRSSVEMRQYVRDPDGVMDQPPPRRADLPPDAEDTGYRLGGLQLWLSAADPDSAYLRAGAEIERWPRADPIVACM